MSSGQRRSPRRFVERLTSGQRPYVAALVVVVVVLATMLTGPLERWTIAAERTDELRAERDTLAEQVEGLEERRERLEDPDEVELDARQSGMVRPGEIPFVVVVPETDEPEEEPEPEPDDGPWWDRLGQRVRDLF